jgi:hypothetical protein
VVLTHTIARNNSSRATPKGSSSHEHTHAVLTQAVGGISHEGLHRFASAVAAAQEEGTIGATHLVFSLPVSTIRLLWVRGRLKWVAPGPITVVARHCSWPVEMIEMLLRTATLRKLDLSGSRSFGTTTEWSSLFGLCNTASERLEQLKAQRAARKMLARSSSEERDGLPVSAHSVGGGGHDERPPVPSRTLPQSDLLKIRRYNRYRIAGLYTLCADTCCVL